MRLNKRWLQSRHNEAAEDKEKRKDDLKPSNESMKKQKKRSCDHCALPSSSDGITPIVTNSNFVFSLSLLFLCVSVCVCYSFAVFFLSSNRRLKRRRLTGAAAAAISPHRSYAWNYQWPHIARVIVSNPLCFFSCQAADNVFLGTIRIRYFHSNGRSVDGRRWETHFDRSQTALRRCPQVAIELLWMCIWISLKWYRNVALNVVRNMAMIYDRIALELHCSYLICPKMAPKWYENGSGVKQSTESNINQSKAALK